MPLGSFRLNGISRLKYTRPLTVTGFGNAKISTTQNKFGGASAAFDGTGDYLQIVENGRFDFGTGDFTVEAWCYFANTNTDMLIFGGTAQTASFDFRRVNDNTIRVGRTNTAWDATSSGSATSANTWQHIAVSRSGTTIRIFRNGTQIFSGTNTISYQITDFVHIGGRASETFFNGYIDELRVSNTARYTAAFTAPTAPFTNDANTLLLLHMNGTNNSTVFLDDAGTGRSAVGLTANGDAQIDTAQSKFNSASGLFDGSGDYIIAANTALLNWNTQPYTIEYWTRINALTSQPNDDPLIVGNTNPNGQEDYWSFGPDNSGNLTFKYFNGSSITVKDTGTMSTGVWYHCAAVINSSTIKIYLDGVEKGSAAISGTPQFNTAYGGLNIGWGRTTNLAYNGWIDELRVSNTARYTANFTPSTTTFNNDANTLLLIHFDGADASTNFVDDNG